MRATRATSERCIARKERWKRRRGRAGAAGFFEGETVAQAGGELLAATGVFDVYEGEQVGEGKRSLALRLEFRALDRTLTEDEVADRRTAIVAALEQVGGQIRG